MNKNKKFVLRVYIVLAVMWSSYWFLFKWNVSNDGIYNEDIFIYMLTPIPLYFALWWILKSLK